MGNKVISDNVSLISVEERNFIIPNFNIK